MAWAKLHTSILGDPKLIQAARHGSKQLHWLPWLIAFAKQADDGGRLSVGGAPAELEDLAFPLPGATTKAIGQCIAELEAIGVLVTDEDGAFRFTQWENRQEKPSASPEAVKVRVQKHRAKKRGNAQRETPSNALQVTPGNAVEERRGDTEGEGEGEPPALHVTGTNWPARFAGMLGSLGEFSPGEVGKHLKPAVERHGEVAVGKALELYCRTAPHEDKRPEFLGPKDFARRAGIWVQRSAPVKVYDDNGDMTPEAARLLGRTA